MGEENEAHAERKDHRSYVRMVGSVRVIGTYVIGVKGGRGGKENDGTSNRKMVSIVRVIWTYLLGGKEVTKKKK